MSEITITRSGSDIHVEDERGAHMATFHGDAGERGFALLLAAIAAKGGVSVFDETRAQYLVGDVGLLSAEGSTT